MSTSTVSTVEAGWLVGWRCNVFITYCTVLAIDRSYIYYKFDRLFITLFFITTYFSWMENERPACLKLVILGK